MLINDMMFGVNCIIKRVKHILSQVQIDKCQALRENGCVRSFLPCGRFINEGQGVLKSKHEFLD